MRFSYFLIIYFFLVFLIEAGAEKMVIFSFTVNFLCFVWLLSNNLYSTYYETVSLTFKDLTVLLDYQLFLLYYLSFNLKFLFSKLNLLEKLISYFFVKAIRHISINKHVVYPFLTKSNSTLKYYCPIFNTFYNLK